MNYDLELDRIINTIKTESPKTVCIQLPDGLKQYANLIVDKINDLFPDIVVLIWAGSNYGACDLSLDCEKFKTDILFHFGHSKFHRHKSNYFL